MSEASEATSSPAPRTGRDKLDETARPNSNRAARQSLDAAVLDEIVRRVVAVAKPDRIILFGSAARGAMGPDSDVDLLVIKSGVQHRRRLAEEIYLNLSGIELPVDIVVASPEDVKRYGTRVGSVIRPALREGQEIYVT